MTTIDTIVALSTPQMESALGVIRISGSESLKIIGAFFKGKNLAEAKSHTIHYGNVVNEKDELLDEVVVAIYLAPKSYTGETVVEISCHGSVFIMQQILNLCVKNGARLARAGEFTQRAFMNGKFDLSQAEAVADIIASENESQHRMAYQQMRGGYSNTIKVLRQELIDFAALMELELDFSEEDVEFADREKFLSLIDKSLNLLIDLINSFKLGNAYKKGIPIAIIGKPNAGKSTLLNLLLNDEKAIVSDIAGTTRDFIEDTIQINGITYRFIDTAGIRDASDSIEAMGIERSFDKMKQADLVLYLHDINDDYKTVIQDFNSLPLKENQQAIIVLTKSDASTNLCNAYDIEEAISTVTKKDCIEISAKDNRNIDKLIHRIEQKLKMNTSPNSLIVSNARHLEAFKQAKESLELVREGLKQKISGEFLSIDIRKALQSLGSITGQITNEDVLSSVFSRFCIGK